jgi:hypothetical protein
MGYFKSPLNWVGNKYKHMEDINSIVSGKKYNKVIDAFLGAGSVLFNIDVQANYYIGNDKIKLTPKFYQSVRNINVVYSVDKFDEISKRWNEFVDKKDYYDFRDHWNKKYLNDNFDEEFVYETVMLLKMCSNSMVRFNANKGYFNQGFRGVSKDKYDKSKSFFSDVMKTQSIQRLNELTKHLQNRNYNFKNENFINLTELYDNNNNLLILDPPYILMADVYDTNYNAETDDKLFDLLKNTKNDFVYFNYLKNADTVNNKLVDFIDKYNFNIIEINDKGLSGQGRNLTKDVSEVIVTNIKI